MPPTLDMSDALDAVEFIDTFLVTTNQGIIGSGGLDVETPSVPILVQGIVVPGKSTLTRAADGSRVAAYIDIYTAYPLSQGFKSSDSAYRDADTILWHGRTWTVMTVEDYSAFGPGFLKVGADLLELSPPA